MERIIDGIITRRDAEQTLGCIKDFIRDYGRVTLTDVKDLIGLPGSDEDCDVSWGDDTFKNAVVDPDANGRYEIVLLTDDEMAERRSHNGIYIFI